MRRDELADIDDDGGFLHAATRALGAGIARYPGRFAAGSLAFAVIGYGTVNALVMQDGPHPSAIFETRGQDGPARHGHGADAAPAGTGRNVTRIVFDDQPARRPERAPVAVERIVMPEPAAPDARPRQAQAEPIVELQTMLGELGFYGGAIDGIKGPQTRAAVDEYKHSVGLRGIELTTEELLTSLRNNTMVTAAIPRPRPQSAGGEPVQPAPPIATVEELPVPASAPAPGDGASPTLPDRRVVKVQAGLKAFGNDKIAVDGIAGEQTRAAVREFQALFRLPVTGEIDDALVDKMVAIGLID
ncbi:MULTISPECIES: peptidoglycan-binding protein [unclassified Roseitalea]|uniref:peptidoglycan-binding domain-containing protein n=1 Tax=unclassified Roseitalea TaxID=2639107 RepID=UPI00273FD4CE|nr:MULTISPECIES: peptidoglycan-binding protein [unclassified Roseitalea]